MARLPAWRHSARKGTVPIKFSKKLVMLPLKACHHLYIHRFIRYLIFLFRKRRILL